MNLVHLRNHPARMFEGFVLEGLLGKLGGLGVGADLGGSGLVLRLTLGRVKPAALRA